MVKEKNEKSRRDLETMTEKSQAVVRLNAQLMAQVCSHLVLDNTDHAKLSF